MTTSEQPGTNPPQPDPTAPSQPYPGQPHQPAQPYPGQPYQPQAPYPGQPYSGQPYQPQPPFAGEPPQPVAPWAAQAIGPDPGQFYAPAPQAGYPPQAPPPPARHNRVPLILAGAVTGLILLAVVATFVLGGGGSADPASAPTPGRSATVASPATATARDAVQGYLEALARGDAAAALAYAATPPADATLLTDEVLAASLAVAPLRNISVAEGTGSAGSEQVTAAYLFGERAVGATFTAVRSGTDWRLERVTQEVSLASLNSEVSRLRINGVPLTGTELELFPGQYAITSDSARYSVSKGEFTLDSPTAFTPRIAAISLALSKAGVAEVRTAAQQKLRSCLKAKKLAPAGCGFATRLPTGKPVASTITWKVTKGANALKKLKPTLSPDDPTLASGSVTMTMVCTFDSTNGYSWRGVSGVYSVQARFSADGVKVTFN